MSYRSLGECTLANGHVVGCLLESWCIVIYIGYYNCDSCVTFKRWASIVLCLAESKRKLVKSESEQRG